MIHDGSDGRSALGIQVFAADPSAPRDRRTADAFVAIISVLLIAGAALVSDDPSELGDRWSAFAQAMPDWVSAMAGMLYFLGGAYLLILIVGVAFVAHQRLDVLRDLTVSLVVAAAAAVALSFWVSGEAPDIAFTTSDLRSETFPAFWLTLLTAAHSAVSPQLSRPLRLTGWAVVLAGAAAGMLADITGPTDTLGALLVGSAVGATVRFVFGSPAGRPSLERVAAALSGVGVEVEVLRLDYAPRQPIGTTVIDATTTGGDAVQATVLGRDAEQNRALVRAWRYAWYHDERVPQQGRLGRLEHSALASMLAADAGVETPGFVALGEAGAQDAVLVTTAPDPTFADLEHDVLDDDVLDRIWGLADRLHSARLAHGTLDLTQLTLAEGRVGVTDFTYAQIPASEDRTRQDEVQVLVSTALVVGDERAVAAAERALGAVGLGLLAPYLQAAALSPALGRQVRVEHFSVRELRSRVADVAGTDKVHLQQLHRVSIQQILMVAFGGVAAYLLISAFANVGLEETLDALSQASLPAFLAILAISQLAVVANAFVVIGSSPKPLPFGVVAVQQFAQSFINLATPSSAGRVAVNVRFAQKMGIPNVNAMTLGAIASLSGFVVQVFWLVLLVGSGDWSIDWSEMKLGGTVLKLAGMALVIGLLALLVALVARRARNWLRERTREPLAQLRSNLADLRSPQRLSRLFGGNIANQVLLAVALVMSTLAVGGEVSLTEALFINTVVSLFAGLMPIPGGVGVTEAGLSAGLIAVGVPEDVVFAAVLLFRLCTFYLPPIWGWFALRWMTDRDYL